MVHAQAKKQEEDEMEEEEEVLPPEEMLFSLHSMLKSGETVASALRRSPPPHTHISPPLSSFPLSLPLALSVPAPCI